MESESERRKYNKIGYTARANMLNFITVHGKSIKQASLLTGINYSTAKTLLMVFRKKLRQHRFQKFSPPATTSASSSPVFLEPCGFRNNIDTRQTLQQVVSVGGKQELPSRQSKVSAGTTQAVEIVSTIGLAGQN